jgi:hypothetical protein
LRLLAVQSQECRLQVGSQRLAGDEAAVARDHGGGDAARSRLQRHGVDSDRVAGHDLDPGGPRLSAQFGRQGRSVGGDPDQPPWAQVGVDECPGRVLCLRILQAALVYVNTLMLQDVLAEDDWTDILTAEDRRGLTPPVQQVLPFGEVKLDMSARLSIRTTTPGDASTPPIDAP